MTFLAPPGLLFLAGVPLVLLLWLLHARFRIERVSSLLLWRDVPAPRAATRSWRLPRPELLLLLQLAAVSALALALGRPAADAAGGRHVALVLDASVTMQATDVSPSRFDAARNVLASILDGAGAADRFDLIIAGATPFIVQRAEGPAPVRASLAAARVDDLTADLGTAITLAASPGISEVIVATDGAAKLDLPPQSAPVSFKLVGGRPDELALSDVSLRQPIDGSQHLAGFASVANFGPADRSTTVQVIADTVLVDAQAITLQPSARADLTFTVPLETRTVRVALTETDAFAADKRVDLFGPRQYARSILVVSDDPSLWTHALAAIPLLTVRSLAPADYRPPSTGEMVVFDRFLPPDLPDVERILVDPPPSTTGVVDRQGDEPRVIGSPSLDVTDPLLHGVDLAGLTVSTTGHVVGPTWASLTAGTSDDFLVGHGLLNGRRTVVLAFNLSSSNLSHLAAFPLLAANAIDWLSPGRGEIIHGGLGPAVDITPRPQAALERQTAPAHVAAWFDLWPAVAAVGLLVVVAESALAYGRRLLGRFPLIVASLAALSIAMALVQPGLWVPDRAMTIVLAVDRSASISAAGQAALTKWLAEAGRVKPSSDRLARVEFGAQPVVSQAPSTDAAPSPAVVDPQATDLAAAIRTAAAVARNQGPARVVLLSDGQATSGDLGAALDTLSGLPVDVVPLDAPPPAPAIVLESLDLPRAVRAGESLDAVLLIGSTDTVNATLRVALDGRPLKEQAVALTPGHTRLNVTLSVDTPGFHRLSVGTDTSTLDSFVIVKPPERVLLVEERPGESTPIATALRSLPGTFDVRPPGAITGLSSLEPYDAVVLADVSATSFSLDQQRTLQSYVRERGRGLVALGGPTSFALGAYESSALDQILPVSSTIPPRREDAQMALLLVIDISQSMDRVVDGVSGIEMAKQAAVLASRALREDEQVGVLIFNHRFTWLQPIARLSDIGRANLENKISTLTPSGGTEIFAALDEGAARMRTVIADLRHIVLFTDGNSRDANYDALTSQLRQDNIGLSTVGLGPEADTKLLAQLAKDGQGRFYYSDRPSELPRILAREVAIAKRSAVVEGTIEPRVVSPSPVLRSIAADEIPPLAGYIATEAKIAAQVVLATADDKPLLAHWRIGLGRAVAWTSDVGGPWSHGWPDWAHHATLWQQAVGWAAGTPLQPDFLLDVTAVGSTAHVVLDEIRDEQFVNLASPVATIRSAGGGEQALPLRQSAPGRYEATLVAGAPGTYQVEVVEGQRSEASGFVVRGNPEQSGYGADEHTLRRITSATGGQILTSPADAFRQDGRADGQRWAPLWPVFLALGLLLFLVGLLTRRFSWVLRRPSGWPSQQ